MNKVVLCAGGHTRSLLNLLSILGTKPNSIYDDNWKKGELIMGIPVVGTLSMISKTETGIISSGDPTIRKQLAQNFQTDVTHYIHPTALIEKGVTLDHGVHIFAQAYINTGVKIGQHVLVNSKAMIEHETIVGDYCHIAVGAILCGRCVVGNNVFIGAGAVVKDKVRIADNVIIGAGAVVVKDIVEEGTYTGIPAKRNK